MSFDELDGMDTCPTKALVEPMMKLYLFYIFEPVCTLFQRIQQHEFPYEMNTR
jgi:uncharacterized membrane protein